jgi:hypothetical protein
MSLSDSFDYELNKIKGVKMCTPEIFDKNGLQNES